MRPVTGLIGVLVVFGLTGHAFGKSQSFAATDPNATESYSHVPMPPGFKVVVTPLEGPVFADSHGKTLYDWPIASMRQGYAGDPKDKSVCEDKVTTKTGGYMSPYPEGLDLPELDKRKSCKAEWAPVMADAKAQPVGEWTLITRSDGTKQWAYDHHALYTSYLDHEAGDVLGGTTVYRTGGDTPAERIPVGPPADVPPGFGVESTVRGRMLLTDKKKSVYASDHDAADKSNCDETCQMLWHPLLAPATARPHGDWSIVNPSPSIRQWAFRKKPLYSYARDTQLGSLDGTEEVGWHNVYLQLTPPPPKGFSVQETINGDVLADNGGKTIYFYTCGDDSADQLSCDTLDSPQEYRLAICGGGDAERCHRMWHYVPAAADSKSTNRLWTIVSVDPASGHEAQPHQADALRVWAYRGRPVYTYASDTQPGDFAGQARGEWQGRRNGFRAFWIRTEEFGR
jgi:predicted lipoprotein with Yx(FWY)xxD motif